MKRIFAIQKGVMFVLAFAVIAVLSTATLAQAVVVSQPPATVSLSMDIGESITVTPSLATLPAFVYTPGQDKTGTQSFTVTTAWQLAAGHTTFNLAFWLSSATAALSNGSTNIPASDVFLGLNGAALGATSDCGRAAIALNGSVANATCNQGIAIPLTNLTSTRTDTVQMQIQGLNALTLSSGHYAGVLNITAAAN